VSIHVLEICTNGSDILFRGEKNSSVSPARNLRVENLDP
jgi:hypothetical protein